MRKVVLIGLVGIVAQFIDGSLGMAYGATTATLLLAVGLAPALASTITHLAEIGTTLAAGISHQHFGNVDWRALRWLVIPGAFGAFLGAYVLSNIDGEVARPWMAGFLCLLGLYILVRYATEKEKELLVGRRLSAKFLLPLGLFAGFIDAAGGGGWGPVGTSSLLASRRIEPRKAVGTIDTSEFLIAIAASAGFLVGLGREGIPWDLVIALLIGGVIAAPIAAWLVRMLHPRILGTAAGGLVAVTNIRTALKALGVDDGVNNGLIIILASAWLIMLAVAIRRIRIDRARQRHRPAAA